MASELLVGFALPACCKAVVLKLPLSTSLLFWASSFFFSFGLYSNLSEVHYQ